MSLDTIFHYSWFVLIVASILPLVFRKLWLRLCCVFVILLITAVATMELYLVSAIVISKFQHTIKPGTNAAYGQWFVHDVISATLPIFFISVLGLAAMAFVPVQKKKSEKQ